MQKAKKKGLTALIIVASVLLILILHITFNVNPIIEQVSEKEVNALAEKAINEACGEVLSEIPIAKIIDYVMDKEGNLQLITTDTSVMNAVSRRAIELSQEKIEKLGEQGVPIPLGSLTGITVFSGQGPQIYIKVFPIGSIGAVFTSEFISAGINQTRHKILLNVTADIRVVMPGADNVVTTKTQILMCENIIVGNVPNTFFGLHNLSDLLDLVP